jgi:hypothetical protein
LPVLTFVAYCNLDESSAVAEIASLISSVIPNLLEGVFKILFSYLCKSWSYAFASLVSAVNAKLTFNCFAI